MTTPSLRQESDRLQRLKRNAVYVPPPPDIEAVQVHLSDIPRFLSPTGWSIIFIIMISAGVLGFVL